MNYIGMNYKYIDAHTHINFPEFDVDREAVISRAKSAGVFIVNVGTDLGSSKAVVELASKNDGMKAIVGIHPTEIKSFDTSDKVWKELLELAKNENVVGIGECGLDYFHAEEQEWGFQKEAFIKQIEIANLVGKSLMLHIRNGKTNKNAYKEVLEILRDFKKDQEDSSKNAKVHDAHNPLKADDSLCGNVHFFAGTLEEACEFIDLGFSISFTGVLTFTRDYDEIVKFVPLNMILSETDAPFVAPVPYRGKRNEPVYVIEAVKKMAEIKGVSEDLMAEEIMKNAKRLFKI
ncbi:MAG: TatD family hydrolase [bacterium]|nr:TatD family hydrolase [bacterium]